MIVQIDIPDNAIKQDEIVDSKDILNLIDSGFIIRQELVVVII